MNVLVSPLESPLVKESAPVPTMQDDKISQTVIAESRRLRRFIARYVVDRAEAEDILQDVFHELVDAYRLMKPIEQASAWLVRVARNRIIDRFRKQRTGSLLADPIVDEEGEQFTWDEFLPDSSAGPEETFARELMLQQIEEALAELPPLQREVFIAHEIEGRSFKEMAAQLNVSVNTLLSRKHEAVSTLRRRLQQVYQELF